MKRKGKGAKKKFRTKRYPGTLSEQCPIDCPYAEKVLMFKTKKKVEIEDRCTCLENPSEVWRARFRCYLYETRNYEEVLYDLSGR